MKKLLTWLDDNILLILSGFLIAFIPLYPKIPLFSPIESYIVRVRIEDIVVFATAVVALIQFLRKKITIPAWPMVIMIGLYALTGLLTLVSAVFFTQTIPPEALHVGKSVLHYLRYLEYFTLFFIVAASIKSARDVKVLLISMVLTVAAISFYGYGQRYYYWPVYSTMNREFSKGIRLYLTEHARVQSTFGGHYDLAAYLVITLPLVLSLAYFTLRRRLRIALYLVFGLGSWLLIMSASRTSFVAYLLGISLVTLLAAWFQPSWLKKITWSIKHFTFVYLSVFLLMATFGSDMYERFVQALEAFPTAHRYYHTYNKARKDMTNELVASLEESAWFKGSTKPQKPSNGIAIDNTETGVALVPSDERPVPEKPNARPSDVYVDVPEKVEVATISATGEKTITYVEKDRVFSDCALTKGLSLCIRLETLWPKALEGFMRNPLFGSGYATLNKDGLYHFTEAESTDNNFLRTLGETGLLGFITFYGSVLIAMWYAWLLVLKRQPLTLALGLGFIGGTLGLLVNALYIDVFAASKVAFTYWGLTGLIVGYYWSQRAKQTAPEL